MAHLPPTAVRCDLRCFADSKDHDNGRPSHGETPQQHQNPDSKQPTDLKDQAKNAALLRTLGIDAAAMSTQTRPGRGVATEQSR
jgi:hypothetical protein